MSKKPRQKKFALIWWVESKETDIVPLLKVPKRYKFVGADGELIWKDEKTKKETKIKMKVLAINTDQEELRKVLVNDKGEMIDESAKIFSSDVLKKKKEIRENSNFIDGIKNSNKTKIEAKIINSKPILSRARASFTDSQNEKFPNQSLVQPNLISNTQTQNFSQSSSFHIFHQILEKDNYESPPGLPFLNEPVAINLISNTANNSYKKDTILPCSSTLSYSPTEANEITCLNISSSLIPISNSKQIVTEVKASSVPEQKKKCCLKTQNEAPFNGLIEVPKHSFKKEENNVEVAPNSNLFMQEETKLRIESIAENNWCALVGETLEEIYGENLINYSAKGKGPDSRPAIDHRVLKDYFNGRRLLRQKK